jgi:hypothetical protein
MGLRCSAGFRAPRMRCDRAAGGGAAGEVLYASAPLAQSGLSETLAACVMDRVFAATFARPEGGAATIVIPVTFVSQ